MKRRVFAGAALLTAAAVAFVGPIGFVGLIVPQALRMMLGPDNRVLVPTAFLGGGAFLLAADTLARNVIAPAELSVGVITSFCGAPFFIYLLRSRAARVAPVTPLVESGGWASPIRGGRPAAAAVRHPRSQR